MQRLGQQDLRIADSFSDGVVLFLSSKRQLRERRLITGRVLDVDEVLVVRDAVVFRQLEQANESLEQRSPGDTGRVLVLHTCARSTPVSVSADHRGVSLAAGCSPEFGVLRVHHGRTLGQDLCDADRADFLLDCSGNLLDFWDDYFFQHHAEHPARGRAKVGINPGGKEAASSLTRSHFNSESEQLWNASVYKVRGF